jgi:flagellar FliL protein
MAKEAKENVTVTKPAFPTKLIIVSALASVLIGGGIFFALHYFSEIKSSFSQDNAATETKVDTPKKETELGMIYPMEPFIVNLLDKGGKRYLKVKMELEIPTDQLAEEITRRKAQLRDTILLLLTSKNFEDVNRLEGKFQLRNELIFGINQVLQSGKIQTLYFTEFVVQ